jgi:hypothetical protein
MADRVSDSGELDADYARILSTLLNVENTSPSPESQTLDSDVLKLYKAVEGIDDIANATTATATSSLILAPAPALETALEIASASASASASELTPTPTLSESRRIVSPVHWSHLYSFVQQTLTPNSWAVPGESINRWRSFLKGVLNLLGLRLPQDAKGADYSLGIFLYFLKLSMLVISNDTINASLWTGIIQAIKAKKFPGNSRVDPLFLVIKYANEQLSFPTTLYDKTVGTREVIPPASAALLGIFTAAITLKLLILLANAIFKMKRTSVVSIVSTHETAPLLPTNPGPGPTPASTHPFVRLFERYNAANIWSRFFSLVAFNTIGTLIAFIIINAVSLDKVTYPNIPNAPLNNNTDPNIFNNEQTPQINDLLNDPQSFMLLLTLGSLAASILVGIIYGLFRAGLISRDLGDFITNAYTLVTVGENPLHSQNIEENPLPPSPSSSPLIHSP